MFMRSPIALALGLLALSSSSFAATSYFDNFTPLAASAGPTANEAFPITLSSPFFSQKTLADRTSSGGSAVNSGNWDMIAANETGPDAGRYLFAPFETGAGGVMRTDLWNNNPLTRTVTIVANGMQGFVAGDASRWTPWGSYLTAEESWGTNSTKGRLFEVTNATTATAGAGNFISRNVLPRVSHEGLAFDAAKALYFVDELNGGSIYKYVSANANATTGDQYFDKGQTFVLKVGAGGQFEGTNSTTASLTGAASWVAITTATGTANAATFSAMVNVGGGVFSLDGRQAADLVGGTGYNRPEDLEVQTVNGQERIYFATTSGDSDNNSGNGNSRVYWLNTATAEVNLFADQNTIDLATGLAVGGALRSADNLAIDAKGNIYIIEDRDGGVDDDIWFARDLNKDGDLLDAGEGIGRWASNGTPGSEFTGLYFDKFDVNKAYVNIQHPSSGVDRLIEISAVPEPETYAMMLAGLVGVGFMARRRKA